MDTDQGKRMLTRADFLKLMGVFSIGFMTYSPLNTAFLKLTQQELAVYNEGRYGYGGY